MRTKFFVIIILMSLLNACEKENESKVYNISGKAQKGPFIKGSNVILNELDGKLTQSGKAFTATIDSDNGNFIFNQMELESQYVLLTASGYYFSEIYGELSSATLTLQAISDLSHKESVNINVLTHLTKGRIEKLVTEGGSYQKAKEQAEKEFLNFLGVADTLNKSFEELDFYYNDEADAILLAFSIMLQRYTNVWNEKPSLTAEITQLLSNLSSDFTDNGEVGDQSLIDTLLYNISQLDISSVRNYIEARYTETGTSKVAPNFEKYIRLFQEKYSPNLYSDYYYPEMESPMPEMSPDSKVINLLFPDQNVFKAGRPYCMAAITQLYKTLKIKFIITGGSNQYNYTLGGPYYGWGFVNESPSGFTLNSLRQNSLMSMLIYLENPGSATIEYYENGSETPSMTRQIEWRNEE